MAGLLARPEDSPRRGRGGLLQRGADVAACELYTLVAAAFATVCSSHRFAGPVGWYLMSVAHVPDGTPALIALLVGGGTSAEAFES
jgi:hypothetical protein